MSGVTFTVGLEDRALQAGLGALAAELTDMTTFMDAVGRVLVNGAVQRIGSTNVSPDGTPWVPSKRATEDGGRTLVLSGILRTSINAWAAPDHVLVGTNVPYAAVHQMGAAVGSLGIWIGEDKRGRQMTVLSPWGDIPARPYLGISRDEETDIHNLAAIHFPSLLERLQ